MAGLASGADAAYIYEEPFNIHDLQVSTYRLSTRRKNPRDHINQRSTVGFNFHCPWKFIVEISVDQCGASCGEDEDNCQKRTYSEVCKN